MGKGLTNKQAKQRSAVIYQSLYLTNLLLVPGVSFLLLLWLFVKYQQQPGWQRIHLYRAMQLSLLAGFALAVLPLSILFFQPVESTWMVLVLYFVTMHAALVLIGMLNLSRAMSRKLPLF